MKRITLPLLGIGLLFIASGCAAGPADERVSAIDSLIRAADELGAPKAPQAALYLQLARDENERAQKLLRTEDPEAKGQLMRAQADAELALALALARDVPMQIEAEREAVKARTLPPRTTE